MLLQGKSYSIEQTIRRRDDRQGSKHIYRAAADLANGSPTLEAASSVFEAAKRGGNVIISSGFTIISAGRCETDGPIGSVVVGRLINEIGCHLIFLTDSHSLSLFEALCKVANLDSYECLAFPIENAPALLETKRIFSELSPVAVIAIERPGWNWKSVHHNMRGQDISSKTGKVDHIFNRALVRNTLTVGIGDGGNEIGMGNIAETVRQYVRFGSFCQCPCNGGIASVTRADHLIASSVSNWGAYGLTALLANLANLPFRHTPDDEHRLIKVAVEAGAVDGVSGKQVAAVDGIGIDENAETVRRIFEIANDES